MMSASNELYKSKRKRARTYLIMTFRILTTGQDESLAVYFPQDIKVNII